MYDPMVSEDKIREDLRLLWESQNISTTKINEQLLQCVVHSSHTSAILEADAVAILTEWEEFKLYDWSNLVKQMKQPPLLLDGRNILPLIENPILQHYTLGNA